MTARSCRSGSVPTATCSSAVSKLQLTGSGPVLDRQEGPHAHCVLPHPYNGFVYALDLGADLLLQLTFEPETGVLAVVAQTQLPPGAGPRHMVFTPSGSQVLVVEELSSTLAVFDVREDGELTLAQRISLLPAGFDGESTGADIVMAPTGDRVFASNRGDDSVVRFDLGLAGLGGDLVDAGRYGTAGSRPEPRRLDAGRSQPAERQPAGLRGDGHRTC